MLIDSALPFGTFCRFVTIIPRGNNTRPTGPFRLPGSPAWWIRPVAGERVAVPATHCTAAPLQEPPRLSIELLDKGKPAARQGRKARGLEVIKIARLPKARASRAHSTSLSPVSACVYPSSPAGDLRPCGLDSRRSGRWCVMEAVR